MTHADSTLHVVMQPQADDVATVTYDIVYELAGLPVWMDQPMTMLQSFQRSFQGKPPHQGAIQPGGMAAPISPIRQNAYGSIGGRLRVITVFQSASGYVIETADIGHFLTNKMTQEVRPLRLEEDVPNSLLEEAILGTPLLLLLALRGRWLLHCSSVTDQVRTVAFVGPSGYGKSTLGEYLNGYGGWQRVSDDMLPVSNAGGSISAWPHFPQFKLSSAHQPGSLSSSADHAIKYIHYCPAGRINHTN